METLGSRGRELSPSRVSVQDAHSCFRAGPVGVLYPRLGRGTRLRAREAAVQDWSRPGPLTASPGTPAARRVITLLNSAVRTELKKSVKNFSVFIFMQRVSGYIIF